MGRTQQNLDITYLIFVIVINIKSVQIDVRADDALLVLESSSPSVDFGCIIQVILFSINFSSMPVMIISCFNICKFFLPNFTIIIFLVG